MTEDRQESVNIDRHHLRVPADFSAILLAAPWRCFLASSNTNPITRALEKTCHLSVSLVVALARLVKRGLAVLISEVRVCSMPVKI